MTDRCILVTGASRGIGRAIALRLARDGFDIAVHCRSRRELADTVAAEIEALGRKARVLEFDVADRAACASAIEADIETHGAYYGVVNNAGITRDGLLIRMKEESWDAVLSTDLKSDFLTIKAAAQMMMRKKKGSIINIASVVGIMGNIGQANYAAAKAGVIGLTKACAKELAARNIRVNAVAPGFIATDMTDAIPEKNKEAMLTAIPLGRMGLAEDVAKAVSFLASDDASYITGQVLKVDGGMVM